MGVEQFGEESRKRVVGAIVVVVEGITADTPLHKVGSGHRSGRPTITAIATATVTTTVVVVVIAVTGVEVVELGEGVEVSELREERRR